MECSAIITKMITVTNVSIKCAVRHVALQKNDIILTKVTTRHVVLWYNNNNTEI